ncbi:MAG: iduronate 2-sulfatase [Chlamydiales bacterium]|jgi:iduronate 2-sulfatase
MFALWAASGALWLFGCAQADSTAGGARPNVLLIAIDDLRPELGCYGVERALTPNLDKLASGGVCFTSAYCQAAICTPSRTSLLTGYRPDSTGVVDLQAHFRDTRPHVVTLPQSFKSAGYRSVSVGKLFHKPDPASWSEPVFHPDRGLKYALEENRAPGRDQRGPAVERVDVPDEAYRDGLVAEEAIQALRRLKDEPFFLAVGFYKPHLPFAAPARYWDLYARENIDLPLNASFPEDAPSFGRHDWHELRVHGGIPEQGPLDDSVARELVHGYLACVSYVDAQVGKVLDELDALGLADDTIVVVWSDHGYYLGEHGMWCKMGTLEEALRVPLIVRAPGVAQAGAASAGLVELVDVYPSLCELAGLPVLDHLEGTSFVPLLAQPARDWKRAVFSQQANATAGVMGYSVRTKRLRFTSWRLDQAPFEEVATELYDHDKDPGESRNVSRKASYAKRVSRMRTILDGGWQASIPE